MFSPQCLPSYQIPEASGSAPLFGADGAVPSGIHARHRERRTFEPSTAEAGRAIGAHVVKGAMR